MEGFTGSLDLYVRRKTSLEFFWLQDRVACIYDNWQSIFEDLPDALNAQRCNGRSPTDSNQGLQYASEAAG